MLKPVRQIMLWLAQTPMFGSKYLARKASPGNCSWITLGKMTFNKERKSRTLLWLSTHSIIHHFRNDYETRLSRLQGLLLGTGIADRRVPNKLIFDFCPPSRFKSGII